MVERMIDNTYNSRDTEHSLAAVVACQTVAVHANSYVMASQHAYYADH